MKLLFQHWTFFDFFKTMHSVWTKSHATKPTIDTNHNADLTMSLRQPIEHQTRCRFTKVNIEHRIDPNHICTHTQCHAMSLCIQMHDVNAFILCHINIYKLHATQSIHRWLYLLHTTCMLFKHQAITHKDHFQFKISSGLSKMGP